MVCSLGRITASSVSTLLLLAGRGTTTPEVSASAERERARRSSASGRLRTDTKVSSIPSSDGSDVAHLASYVEEDSMTPSATKLRSEETTGQTAIRPFRVNVPEADLTEMRRRIAATRFPEKETVTDFSQGVQLAFIQALARYWATDYDWRKVEAKLNSYPNFLIEIDGLDIHFMHIRSQHENAMPLIVTHGWPGSPIEQLKIIDPLTNPTAHGGSASDAFHVVIPSMAGYGFSGKPATPGWDPAHMARAWVQLMKRLGYSRFAAQGGDWGGFVTNAMA